jgi:pyruvate dehydrogenase E2 component (dihydrolipoamide acetyltransferase)
MESGSIAKWILKEGDSFAAGDVMCSVETDKATVDFEAQDAGFIAKILVSAGPDEIQCGQPILVTVEETDYVAAFANFTLEATSSGASNPATAAAMPTTSGAASAPAPVAPAAVAATGTKPIGHVVASPLAFMLAKQMGHEISHIPGTGPGGRVVAADVKEFVPNQASVTEPATAAVAAAPPTQSSTGVTPAPVGYAVAPPVSGDGYTDFPISAQSQMAAGRLAQSKRNVPHYYLTVDITMDKLLQTRSTMNALLGDKAPLGVYEFLIKAAACSMKAVPSANACWMDSVVRVYDSVDINVVMGQGDSLCMPMIRDCGKQGIASISEALTKTTSILEEKGASIPQEAGTFTVVNVGMFGVKSCAPIIREPQACALAIGALENRIVPGEGGDEMFKESVVMTATLSCDHRVVDGAVGAQWLAAFKSYVENPTTLLL